MSGANSIGTRLMVRPFSRLRLGVVRLEDRIAPATFTVTNTNDGTVSKAGDLPGSLRQAIYDANTLDGVDSIVFDSSVFATTKTIILTSGFLWIKDAVSVLGPAANVTVDA